jgi:thiol-disulfide isomerase/thioredoxin
MNNNVKIFVSVVALLVVGVIATVIIRGGAGAGATGPGKYDTFAQCLAEKGAVFYGAFWCPHCQATKKLFGSSQKLLPYVECSTANGQGQLQVCIDKNVKSYPTWEFADGTRETGELSLQQLADKTQCVLPTE